MSATATQQPPAIPPRPTRGQEKTSSIPMIPPRPTNRRIERSVSPNPARFAPSPLNETLLSRSPKATRNGHMRNAESIDRSTSVDLPSVGEEGREYAGLATEMDQQQARERSTSPEHTRTVGDDLKLHAPKPSLPAQSAKQRVMTVTRTDSDRAASFGIGRPSSNDDSTPVLPSNRSLKKKASTTSQLSQDSHFVEDEHGIPEIGQQVPMYPNAGDVQAPSPAPGSVTSEPSKGKHHARKTSARGILPPGSYGLHGHGVVSQDKLDKAYYEKHPEMLKKEKTSHHHDRPNDFSMSRDDLNKIVRDTASRGSGLAAKNYSSTPSDQIGWQAIEESASRVTSPRPGSAEFKSSKPTFTVSEPEKEAQSMPEEAEVIHVDEPNRRKSVMFTQGETPSTEGEDERPYTAPILAEDEVAKHPASHDHQPAVEPNAFEESTSRPSSRPASLYKESSFEMRSTPLEDVEEYEPLFDEEEKDKVAEEEKEEKPKQSAVKDKKTKGEYKGRFPSADIWEDAPSSVHYTAEVSTPEPSEEEAAKQKPISIIPPPRDGETPAQAFARHQEELAEREARENGPDGFVPNPKKHQKPSWVHHQPQFARETGAAGARPSMGQRFPSRDVWEDTPDSLKLETTVSTPQQDNEASPVEQTSPHSPASSSSKPEIPLHRPAIPGRPKPRQASGDDSSSSKPSPPVSDRPKPSIPARPVKAGPTSGGLEPAEAAAPPRQKPAVPARPMGSKIAALQAGFMSDLNNRLKLGPQAPKKEEPVEDVAPVAEKEKAPLSDARKSRARGPQRRAPVAASAAKSASPAPAAVVEKEKEAPTFSISMPVTIFDVDPEEGAVSVGGRARSREPETAKETKAAVASTGEESEEATEEEEKAATAEVGHGAEEVLSSSGYAAALTEETAEAEAKPEEEKDEEPKEEEDTTTTAPAKEDAEPEPEPAEEKEEEPEPETKSLATNMAGETVVAAEEVKVKKDGKHLGVEPVKVEEY
ncbi:altered inheritance of mitochondria protein 21 [Bombardia bombarda]|uniref:Altered inheritance of mitochondria protein 21 n=1 Tax=Bombardia bombarda TaxID=252184 RepID=A0AA39X8L3_9PEZI|nr:altered inheritance of mitochondria protein 21 [Bombardia bombarda]